MSVPTRESVAVALFNLVSGVSGAIFSSRVLLPPSKVEPAQMPALFQTQLMEPNVRGAWGVPSKRTMHFSIWLYVSYAQTDAVAPSTQLNNMVDAIEAALTPNQGDVGSMVTGIVTLNRLVYGARIDGNIEYAENFTGDGVSVAVIPVQVLLP